MASIETSLRIPKVPDYLEGEVVGRARPMRFRLSAFTEEELRRVGGEYADALVARAEEQRKAGVMDSEPKPRKLRTPRMAGTIPA